MVRYCWLIACLSFLASGLSTLAAEPEVIASGDWSKPVADTRGKAIRGRLVVCTKQRSDERREVAVYIELQDASESIGQSMQIYCELSKTDFRPEFKRGLQCELRDKAGEPVKPAAFAFSGGVPASEWVNLPTDATIRLRTTPFGIYRPGALTICPDLGKLWIIEDGDPGEYFLAGTFTVDPPAERMPPANTEHVWRGTLELPPARIVAQKK
jgi:hypothetical protein